MKRKRMVAIWKIKNECCSIEKKDEQSNKNLPQQARWV